MINLFKTLCLFIISEYCYEEFFTEFNFFHADCLKAAISKCLGLGIVAGSMLVKVPQIIKIFNAKSGEGISLFGTSLELFAILANVSYNFVNGYPFSAYGDGFFLLIQTSIVGALVLHFSGASQKAVLFITVVGAIAIALCSGIAPMKVLWILQASNIPVIFSAKMIQAWTNFKNGSTGQLSAITVSLLFLGSMARIFTSIQETGDSIIIITYLVATIANGVLMAQLIQYWNVSTKTKTSKKSKKKQ